MKSYDAIVLGGGPAGYVCAIRLGQLEQKVVCIEKEEVGGVCLNWGCVPSKAIISASHLYHKIQHADTMGLIMQGVRVDPQKMQGWKEGIIKKLTGGIRGLLRGNGAELLMGEACVIATNCVEVRTREGGKEILEAKKGIVIATGSTTIEIPAFKFDGKKIIGAKEAVSLREIPKRLLVIGGGVIGLELGGAYQRLGSHLTVVEALSSLLTGVDSECTAVVEKSLTKNGAKILKNTKVIGYQAQADGSLVVQVELPEGKKENIAADVVLVAVGMRPNGSRLGLEEIGVKVERGFIPTDECGRTNIPSIYAIGDVSGYPMLAHKASKEGEIVAEVIAGHKAAKDWVGIPSAIFTEPEIATVGLTEAQAKEKGIEVIIGKFPFAALGRALAVNETEGIFKVIADKKTHEVLGIHICGPSATDLISEGALALEMHAFLEDIGLTIHPHPTLGEGLMEANLNSLGQAIHVLNR
ncbi:dihydrolipoyl dehydrogenase [Pajaroellobacter abortibovis]|uniref:Dihydrolipoyl dehydrogenase n=1 Tax=Pajaroellobacter abortibovis TaxID=1882918 RepID=A0A1L6MVX3_9BACT|nr:dihydrolipoyl dehydrogenase [Pajaroellobacter abortibovis]APR99577.1 dihydrolipoyl dehydrogenase [Pajaroellobacter abortibovis]